MARILALDMGEKRTGIAVSDPMQISAQALTTVETPALLPFLKDYVAREPVTTIVIGDPRRTREEEPIQQLVKRTAALLKKTFPELTVTLHDERFTSRMAQQSILQSVPSKKKRQEKGLLDRVSATIILQSFMSQPIL